MSEVEGVSGRGRGGPPVTASLGLGAGSLWGAPAPSCVPRLCSRKCEKNPATQSWGPKLAP